MLQLRDHVEWSKLELVELTAFAAHLEIPLDLPEEVCYTGNSNSVDPPNEVPVGGEWHRPHREKIAVL